MIWTKPVPRGVGLVAGTVTGLMSPRERKAVFNIAEHVTHIRVTHHAKRSNGPAPYHQIVLPDGVWLNIFENGQITATSYENDIAVTGVRNHREASNLTVLVSPKVKSDPEGDEGVTEPEDEERVEVLDLTQQRTRPTG